MGRRTPFLTLTTTRGEAMDYLQFLHGLAWILVAAATTARDAGAARTERWGWVGGSSLLQAAGLWLALAAQALAPGGTLWVWVGSAALLCQGGAALLLLVFVRRGLPGGRGRARWPWMLAVPLALSVILTATHAWRQLDVVLTVLLSLPAGLWAALSIWSYAGQLAPPPRSLRRLALALGAAAAMTALAGPLLHLLAPGAPPFSQPAGPLPALLFLLQLLLATAVAVCLWTYAAAPGDGSWCRWLWQQTATWTGGALVLTLVMGSWATINRGQSTDLALREGLLVDAQVLAAALPLASVGRLTGTDTDLKSPDYHRIKALLTRMRQADPSVRFAYLVARRGAEVVFLVDSEEASSPDYSPPGQVYTEAAPGLRDLFATGSSLVEGPASDRWGTWVSAYLVLPLRVGTEYPVILGLDTYGGDWSRRLALDRLAPILATTLLCLLLLGFLVVRQRDLVAREQITRSELQYRQLFRQMQGGFALFEVVREAGGPADCRCLHMNAAFEQLTGLAAARLVGQPLRAQLNGAPPPWLEHGLTTLTTGEPIAFEEDHAEQGRYYDGRTYCPEPGKFAVMLADITPRRQAEQQLRLREAEARRANTELTARHQALEDAQQKLRLQEAEARKLALVAARTSNGVIVTDEHARIEWVNEGYTRITGYTLPELRGQRPAYFLEVPPPGRIMPPRIRAELLHREGLRTEVKGRAKSGQEYWVKVEVQPIYDPDGNLTHWMALETEITLQKQVDSYLRMLESAIKQSNDAIVITDAQLERPGPHIVFVNEGFTRLTGYAREEVIGLTPRLLQGPDTDRDTLARLRTELRSTGTFRGATTNYRKDGTPFRTEWHISSIRNEAGDITNYLSIQRDITQRDAAEQLLRRREAIMQAVAFAAMQLLEPGEWSAKITAVLALLGQATGVSRAYLCEFALDPAAAEAFVARGEWRSSDKAPGLAAAPPPPADWSWLRALQQGQPVAGPLSRLPEAERAWWAQQDVQSLVAFPIPLGNEYWGFIGFDDCERPRQWAATEVDALITAAATLSGVIQRDRTEMALVAARRREGEVAFRIQQALLYGQPPRGLAGMQVAALSDPSEAVDGDFYDFIQHGDTNLDFVIGDVMGKGVPAALLGAAIKSHFLRAINRLLLTASADTAPELEAVVQLVHSAIVPQLVRLESFVTLNYARIDLRRGVLSYIDCGHTATLHYAATTQSCRRLQGNNLPLGFAAEEHYTVCTAPIANGDVLLFYSDGVTDARNSDGERFGDDRLTALVSRWHRLGATALVARLREELQDFVGGARAADDVTIVAIHIGGETLVPPLMTAHLELTSELSAMAGLRDFLYAQFRPELHPGLSEDVVNLLVLAVHEAASNVVQHAYRNLPGRHLTMEVRLEFDRVWVQLTHWGLPFTLTGDVPEPRFDGLQSRGFGLYIMQLAVDQVSYLQDADGCNRIILTKRLPSPAEAAAGGA